jgi:hypothetical protein
VVSRLLLSLAAGIAVAGTAYLCAWHHLRVSLYHFDHWGLDIDRGRIRDTLDAHNVKKGSYPKALSDLQLQADERTASSFSYDPQGRPLDPWKTPYVYKRTATSYEVWSLGHDGREGGSGFDTDILLDADPRVLIDIQPATLRQFTLDPASFGVQKGCLIAGLFASIVGLVTIRGPKPISAARLSILLATVVMSVFIAVVLSALHIPSGH